MYRPRYRPKSRHWRRLLLTSSQVSIILTSAIILFSTTALFMSGCAIQHRTLRELRIGIKTPRPSPRTYVPDRFMHTTTELEDGTVVVVEDAYHADRRVAQKRLEGRARPVVDTAVAVAGGTREEVGAGGEALTVREQNERAQLARNMAHPDPSAADQRPVSRAERRRLIREELRRLSHVERPAYQPRAW